MSLLTVETESALVSRGPRLQPERLSPATPPYSQLGPCSLMLRRLAEEAPGPRRPTTSNKSQIKTLKSMTTKENAAQTLTSCLPAPAANLKPQPATKVSKLIHSEHPPPPRPPVCSADVSALNTFVFVATFSASFPIRSVRRSTATFRYP